MRPDMPDDQPSAASRSHR